MDHRVSKDMISSGMTPSGEKTQADLGKTQYGSAPSPNRLMDAYHSMYQNQKEETLQEGKIPAGLQAYLDKKKGKKKDDNDDEKKDEKDVKEGAGLYANIHAKRKRGGKMRKKGAKGAPSSQDFANAARTAKEDVDLFDLISTKLIEEGYDEKDVYKVMSNLTEDQLQSEDFGISAALALGAKLAAGAAKAGAIAAKGGAAAGKALGKVKTIASTAPKKGLAFLAKQGSGTQGLKNVATAYKNPTMGNIGKAAGDAFDGATKLKFKSDVATSMLPKGDGNVSNKISKKTGVVSASADLFDIVKGQLIDEGLSEEEIRDIMLELTPEEILAEMDTNYPAGKGANYQEKPKVPEKKKLGGRTDGTAGSYVEKPQRTSTEEYQNVNEISADLLKRASKAADVARGRAAVRGNPELAVKKMKQAEKFKTAEREKKGKPDYSKPFTNTENEKL